MVRKDLFRKALIYSVCVGCFIQSCTSNCRTPACKQQQRLDSLMVLHNQLMIQMPVLRDLKQKVDQQLKSDTASVKWSQLSNQLQNADKRMWDWMHQFKPPADSTSFQQAMEYLSDQYRQLETLSMHYEATIEEAKKDLNIMDQ